ncbi:hypothetical protein PP512_gp25 [Gordonia phage Denise]|uniref:Uncharacterized protein n=1 Tax=Gordonia phage Denise TaxID=2652879 RepID=A0A5P8DD21_9CAUD|nr:hypothetical protein PP512_gp25 [Gordonia phage Denise]QFP96641.1 hypothetical protein SEA_DENISE_25 [Gordonia phage Denise]
MTRITRLATDLTGPSVNSLKRLVHAYPADVTPNHRYLASDVALGNIGLWSDRVGTAHFSLTPTSQRVARIQDGRPEVYMAGGGSLTVTVSSTQPITLVMLMKSAVAAPATNAEILAMGGVGLLSINTAGKLIGSGTGAVASTDSVGTTAWRAVTLVVNGASSVVGLDEEETTMSMGTSAGTNLRIGSTSTALQFSVRELVTFSGVLTSAQRKTVRATMKAALT